MFRPAGAILRVSHEVFKTGPVVRIAPGDDKAAPGLPCVLPVRREMA